MPLPLYFFGGKKGMQRKDCYHYYEYQDMCAHIPCCRLYHVLGKCPCDDCDKFFSNADAHNVVKKYINGELVEKGDI